MAQIRNYRKGIFETLGSPNPVPIGQATGGNDFIQADGVLTNAFSDLVLYTDAAGTSAVPLTDYSETTQDDNATAKEATVGGSGKTVYAQYQVTNATYQGIDLWATFTNFGTYTDNDAASDIYLSTDYKVTQTYADLARVKWGGINFLSLAGSNTGNVPPFSSSFWAPMPNKQELVRLHSFADPVSGGMIPLHDRASSVYKQNFLIDSFEINHDTYNIYGVHLDGSVMTGVSVLESILTGYHALDIYAPDSGGTRTLIDMGERVLAGQSFGGENDVMGEVLEDRFQKFQVGGTRGGNFYYGIIDAENFQNDGTAVGGYGLIRSSASSQGNASMLSPVSDGTNGTPRTGPTNRPKELTTGCPYIIVMVAS